MDTYQIESPVSHRYILIGGSAYNKLIRNNEYTEEYLLSLPRIQTNKKTKSPKVRAMQSQLLTKTVVPTEYYIPPEIVSHISSYMPVPTARASFNKHIYQSNQARYDLAIREKIYNFIVHHFSEAQYQGMNHFDEIFATYDSFKRFQYEKCQALTLSDIDYLNQLIKKIVAGFIYNMDKEGMNPVLQTVFFFYKDHLIMYRTKHVMEEFARSKPKPNKDTKKNFRIPLLYNFINLNFDDYDYDRFVDYNQDENPFKSLFDLMLYQKQMLQSLDSDDLEFLYRTALKIKNKTLTLTSDWIFSDWPSSGFIFLDDKLVIFHER